jgi:hypothetical protein
MVVGYFTALQVAGLYIASNGRLTDELETVCNDAVVA